MSPNESTSAKRAPVPTRGPQAPRFIVIEIEVGEDAVLLHEEIGDDRAGGVDGQGFAEALLAVHQEIHLSAQGGAGLLFVEVGEEGIVFAVVDAAGVQALGKDLGQRAFADAQGALDYDEARGLRSPGGDWRALSGGRFVRRHDPGDRECARL